MPDIRIAYSPNAGEIAALAVDGRGVPETVVSSKEHYTTLFRLTGFVSSAPMRSYDPYPDGQHFLGALGQFPKLQPVPRLNLVVNWLEEVKRRTQATRE